MSICSKCGTSTSHGKGTHHGVSDIPADIVTPEGIIIGPEQPRDPSTMTPKERLASLVELVIRIIGPEPERPIYSTPESQGSTQNVPPGPNGIGGFVEGGTTPMADPNGLQISADYQAALASWNSRFKIVFDELLGEKKMAIRHHKHEEPRELPAVPSDRGDAWTVP